MSVNNETYAYNFAYVDPHTNMCIEVFTTTDASESESDMYIVVELPVYDINYCLKYYNQANGQWYEDAAFTIPWQSSLI